MSLLGLAMMAFFSLCFTVYIYINVTSFLGGFNLLLPLLTYDAQIGPAFPGHQISPPFEGSPWAFPAPALQADMEIPCASKS